MTGLSTAIAASPRSLARRFVEGVGARAPLGLLLDYDGSLVPIRPRPELARADDALLDLLRSLVALPRVRVALASGRSLENLAEVLPPVDGMPRFGNHGAVGLDERGRRVMLAESRCTPLPEALVRAVLGEAWPEGVRVERKPWSVAIHTRGAPEPGRSAAGPRLRTLVKGHDGIDILSGNELLEARPRGLHKGLVVEWLRKRLPPGEARLVCIGDDRTDEDAFGALAPGDLGILVSETPRNTAAEHRLRSPEEVRDFLGELRAAAGEETP